MDEVLVNCVEVSCLPDTGATMASIFRSLSEMAKQFQSLGCLEIAAALLPALPPILGLTVTQ